MIRYRNNPNLTKRHSIRRYLASFMYQLCRITSHYLSLCNLSKQFSKSIPVSGGRGLSKRIRAPDTSDNITPRLTRNKENELALAEHVLDGMTPDSQELLA